MKEQLIAIVGPTTSGKSAVALELAAKLHTEIISADSAQVYRGMDIGTAKLLPAEQRSSGGSYIPHHLIDVVTPEHAYSIGHYQSAARACISALHAAGKCPILCGGSGLYVHAVVNSSYRLESQGADEELRRRLMAEEEARGAGYLHARLTDKYPRRAARIHPHDYQRILRAFERAGDLENEEGTDWQSPYDLHIFGLTLPREQLYRRIEQRVDQMFAAGLVDEVRGLLAQGYCEDSNALSALGYKEVLPLLRGECSEEEAKDLLKRNTRRFAKRQLTWFRRDPRIVWRDVSAFADSRALAANIYESLPFAAGKSSAIPNS